MYKRFKLDFVGGFSVFLGDSMDAAFYEAQKRIGFGLEYEEELALTLTSKIGVSMVFDKNVTDAVVVHECVHCAWHVLDLMGVAFDKDNHEIYALAVEAIYDKTIKFINANR